jgi:hypothetical protein
VYNQLCWGVKGNRINLAYALTNLIQCGIIIIMRVNNKGYIMENLTYKVTYPDGDVEYWAGEGNPTITDEIIRLEKLYDNEIVFEIVEKNNMLMN